MASLAWKCNFLPSLDLIAFLVPGTSNVKQTKEPIRSLPFGKAGGTKTELPSDDTNTLMARLLQKLNHKAAPP